MKEQEQDKGEKSEVKEVWSRLRGKDGKTRRTRGKEVDKTRTKIVAE